MAIVLSRWHRTRDFSLEINIHVIAKLGNWLSENPINNAAAIPKSSSRACWCRCRAIHKCEALEAWQSNNARNVLVVSLYRIPQRNYISKENKEAVTSCGRYTLHRWIDRMCRWGFFLFVFSLRVFFSLLRYSCLFLSSSLYVVPEAVFFSLCLISFTYIDYVVEPCRRVGQAFLTLIHHFTTVHIDDYWAYQSISILTGFWIQLYYRRASNVWNLIINRLL